MLASGSIGCVVFILEMTPQIDLNTSMFDFIVGLGLRVCF